MSNIFLNDGKGTEYQLATAKTPNRDTSSTPEKQLPKDIKLSKPQRWPDAWKILFPAKPCPPANDKIIQAINDALAAKTLQLTRSTQTQAKAIHKAPVVKTASKGGSRSESETLVPAQTVQPHLVQPDNTTSCSDTNAKSQAKPGKTSEKAVTGAASSENTCTRGCPISMVSGEELLDITDFTVPGPLAFTWKRTYRTGHDRDIGLGHGWTHSGCERLYETETELELQDDEGRLLSFARPRLNQRSKLVNEQMSLDFVNYETYILRQHGQPHKVFSRLGRTGLFRLTQIQHPAYKAAIANNDAQGFALNFHYNTQGRVSKIASNWGKSLQFTQDEQGHIRSISLCNELQNTRKLVAEYDYSAENDLIAHRDQAGRGETYHYQHHLFTQRTLATGFSYYYTWDGQDTQARCLRTWGDNGIYDYRFVWNPENNCTTATDSRGFTSEFIYNEFGLIVQETDNEGGVHRYTYEEGLRTAYIDPTGNITRYCYDANKHFSGVIDALEQRQTLSYFQDRLTSSTDKDGALWQRSYNTKGLLETLTAPDGQVTRYQYSTQGLLTAQTNLHGTSRYEWNEAGELVALINPEQHKQSFKYDDWGQIVQMDVWLASRQHGGTTRYFHNASNELIRITYPSGERVDIAYNANGQIERMSDRRGRVTHYHYDGLSQVIRRTDAEGNSLAYEYDTERNLVRLTNENSDIYQFVYDGNERITKEIGFDGRTQHYKYNPAGHLIKHLDAGEVVTEFERDPLGRMLSKTSRALSDNSSNTGEFNRYLYDPVGRLKETYNAHQYLAFQYDSRGQLIHEHHSDLNAQRQRISDSMVDIHYQRHATGQLAKLKLPQGQTIDYQYDHNERLHKAFFNGQTITNIERDTFGFERNRQQGALTTYSDYDPMGRLVKQRTEHKQQQAGVIQREYQYDPFGNLSVFKDGIGKDNSWEVRYVYDMVDRLKRTQGDLVENFVFDPAGNLLTQQKQSTGTTTRGNRLSLQGDRKFEYDARGNLVRETRGKGGKLETLFKYNLNNQLCKVVKDGQTTAYSYDSIGRRICKQDSFGTTRYLWAGDQLAQEKRNNIEKTYIYEPESFKPIAMVQDGEIYHYHLDHLGTPRELTNQQGSIVWKARYKTYGNIALKDVEEVENNLRFQGQYFDAETGLHYNRHRYYDPSLGQFTTQDPIGLLGGVNNYQYAPNPTGWVDPLGLKCNEADRINNARLRQHKMLEDNVGFNVSPTDWDAYPSIGRAGSFVSDKQSVTSIIGNIDGISNMTIAKSEAALLENSFGLEPGSLQNGFKIRKVDNIVMRNPRSPMEGNRFFLGAGNHLPGGAPEMVVDSIPTVDGGGVTTLVEVLVI